MLITLRAGSLPAGRITGTVGLSNVVVTAVHVSLCFKGKMERVLTGVNGHGVERVGGVSANVADDGQGALGGGKGLNIHEGCKVRLAWVEQEWQRQTTHEES